MDDEANLLRAISDRPDDDQARLNYANWLERHAADAPSYGRVTQEMLDRARIIRVQIGLANGTDPDGLPGRALDDERQNTLEGEQERLLRTHRREWDGPLQALGAAGVEYRRGFPHRVIIDVEPFVEHADAIFAAAPIRQALLRDLQITDVHALANTPHLANLSSLSLWGHIGDRGVETIASSPHLRNLTELHFGRCHIEHEGAWAIADSPHLQPQAKQSALRSAGFATLAKQVQDRRTDHQPDGPG